MINLRDPYSTAWQYLNTPERGGAQINGIILNVTALPTVGEDEQERVGGVGQSYLIRSWEQAIDQSLSFDAGQEFRRTAVQRAGLPLGMSVSDEQVIQAMYLLGPDGISAIDRVLDLDAVVAFSLKYLRSSPLVVVGTKILPLLLDKVYAQIKRERDDVLVLNVGVTALDQIATQRRYTEEVKKGNNPQSLKFVSDLRLERMKKDQEKYRKAYNVVYTRRNLEQQTHILFHNNRLKASDIQSTVRFWEMLHDVAAEYRTIAPLLLTYVQRQARGMYGFLSASS